MYDDIYRVQYARQSPVGKQIAEAALRWLLCAKEELSLHDFTAFIGWTLNDHQISEKHILRHTFQLIIYNKELDQLKFPHLSVREYLERKEQYTPDQNHAIIGLGCIRSLALLVGKAYDGYHNLIGLYRGGLLSYAASYWPTHYQSAGSHRLEGELANEMKVFLSAVPCPRFEAWSKLLSSYELEAPLRLRYAYCKPSHPAFVVCLFGFSECLDEMIRSHSLPIDLRTHGCGFSLLAVAMFSCDINMVQKLVDYDMMLMIEVLANRTLVTFYFLRLRPGVVLTNYQPSQLQ